MGLSLSCSWLALMEPVFFFFGTEMTNIIIKERLGLVNIATVWYQTLNLHAKAFPAGVTPKTYQLRSENVSESVLKRVHSYFMKNILLF